MKNGHITEESISRMVHAFYAKVRKDPALAPIFERVIGKDDAAWEPHLHIMCDFWSSVLLTTGRYHGNPMKKHQDIPPFDRALFDRWLELFAETAYELHEPPIAQIYVEKSSRIAQSLQYGLYHTI
jgi:hemoglobin